MMLSKKIISAGRDVVYDSYRSAESKNNYRFLQGDKKATENYIFPNQKSDACNVVDKFYKHDRRVVSIQKKTKVGADGLMIEIAKIFTTHIDDTFVIPPSNVRIITGMSNASWEKDMIEKAPECFKDSIFHHGKLSKADLVDIRDSLVIIDEIDTGDKEFQRLHNTLKDAGILDVEHMTNSNNRFVFISATMIKELYHLYAWGDLHELYVMTIPPSYIGHKDFLEKGIIQEFYPLTKQTEVEQWIQEDIIDNYRNDYRVHIVRVDLKNVGIIQDACIRKKIKFKIHTSTDKLSPQDEKEFFTDQLTQHIVIAVKGFFRRANLIPNTYKLRIGATHERWVKTVDNNVQIQGLTGRMTGYWRNIIESGHKTGPYRMSVKAVEEYENTFYNPFGTNGNYTASGFTMRKGKINADYLMMSSRNVKNLIAVALPTMEDDEPEIHKYASQNEARKYIKKLTTRYPRMISPNVSGVYECIIRSKKAARTWDDIYAERKQGLSKDKFAYRLYPCYKDVHDTNTLQWWVIHKQQH